MEQLVETRWNRYGKDRVYVRTDDEVDIGYVDLRTRTVVARPAVDLARNVAGAAVRAKRNEVNAEMPVRNFVARMLGVKTEERSWRVGAKGEEKVGKELARLGAEWRVLHAVEVGKRGSDIDHVVIGPPGVFTLNAKRHPKGAAWVGSYAVRVNGQPTNHLRNSRYEGQRAEQLLSAACGHAVSVMPVIVFVDLDSIKVKQMPADVHVVNRYGVVSWLTSLAPTLGADTIDAIFAKARLSTTWT